MKSNLVFPVQAVLQRKKYEDKYDVDVFDDPQTGETSVKDRQKDEVNIVCTKTLALPYFNPVCTVLGTVCTTIDSIINLVIKLSLPQQ